MTLEILIDIDNEAFHYDDGEIQRILALVGEAAQECKGAHPSTTIRDVNGNSVGRWRITP